MFRSLISILSIIFVMLFSSLPLRSVEAQPLEKSKKQLSCLCPRLGDKIRKPRSHYRPGPSDQIKRPTLHFGPGPSSQTTRPTIHFGPGPSDQMNHRTIHFGRCPGNLSKPNIYQLTSRSFRMPKLSSKS